MIQCIHVGLLLRNKHWTISVTMGNLELTFPENLDGALGNKALRKRSQMLRFLGTRHIPECKPKDRYYVSKKRQNAWGAFLEKALLS